MIAADTWNKLVARVLRARTLRGIHCAMKQQPDGVIVSGEARSRWQHPWFVSARHAYDEDGSGEWRAFIEPGFVNGRDAYIEMPRTEPETSIAELPVPLTNDPRPHLALDGWRNPLLPGGVSASLDGEIIAAPGEGYPPFFAKLGVKPAAKGGNVTKAGALEGEFDPKRTREIRAVDIVLSQPRLGTRLDIDVRNPLLDAQTESLSTVFLNDYFKATAGRAKLRVATKYQPFEEQGLAALYGTLLRAGDPQFDEIKIATVWMVSPPDADPDAVPDHTWVAYPQHFAFWNLQHASRLIASNAPSNPLRLVTGLAGGVADRINDALLSLINDRNEEAAAFLNQADARGLFWNT